MDRNFLLMQGDGATVGFIYIVFKARQLSEKNRRKPGMLFAAITRLKLKRRLNL